MLILGHYCKLKIGSNFMIVDLRDKIISRKLYIFGVYEIEETKLFNKLIKKNMTVFDLGANIGYYTVLFSQLVGEGGKVLAIEPSIRNYNLIMQNIDLNNFNNVICVNKAVTDKPKEVEMIISNEGYGLNRINFTKNDLSSFDEIQKSVKGVPLSDIAKEYSITPDIIKMDIEGSEYLALQGMKEILSNNENIILVCEYNPQALENSGTQPHLFIEELAELGFKFFKIENNCVLKDIQPKQIVASVNKGENINLLISKTIPKI